MSPEDSGGTHRTGDSVHVFSHPFPLVEKNRHENLKCKFLPLVQKFAHLPHAGGTW